jgi:hypothetical protein
MTPFKPNMRHKLLKTKPIGQPFVLYIEIQPKVLGVFSQMGCNLGFVILA